jgi:hypothetical protein
MLCILRFEPSQSSYSLKVYDLFLLSSFGPSASVFSPHLSFHSFRFNLIEPNIAVKWLVHIRIPTPHSGGPTFDFLSSLASLTVVSHRYHYSFKVSDGIILKYIMTDSLYMIPISSCQSTL